MNQNDVAYERLRWACRRGMLELDLFLVPFFENGYAQLSEAEKKIFIALVSATDPELLAWLMGNDEPPNKEVTALVEKIRLFRQSYSATQSL